MADAAANERQGAKRFGRLASRALLVLGGAVAGTAAAWLLSGASASASTAGIASVTDATTAGLDDTTGDTSRFTGDVAGTAAGAAADLPCHQDATTWSEPGGSRITCTASEIDGALRPHGTHRSIEQKTSDRVTDAVSHLANDAAVTPAERTIGAFEHIVRAPQDTRQVLDSTFTPAPETGDFGKKVWQLFDQNAQPDLVPASSGHPVEPNTLVAGGAPGQISGPVEPAAAQLPDAWQAMSAARHASDLDDPSFEPSSRHGHRELPVPFSPVQLPAAPLSIPTAPGSGSAPGGHLDGMTFGVPSWLAAVVDNAVAGATRSGLRHTPLSPGHQPGVTPD